MTILTQDKKEDELRAEIQKLKRRVRELEAIENMAWMAGLGLQELGIRKDTNPAQIRRAQAWWRAQHGDE